MAHFVSHNRFRLSTTGSVTLLLGLACLGVMFLQGSSLGGGLNPALVGAAAVVVILLVMLDVWRDRIHGDSPPAPIAVGLLIFHFLLVEGIALWDGLTYTSILYLTLPFPAFFMLGRRAGYLVTGGLLLWLSAKFFIFKPYWLSDPTAVNSFALLYVSAALITAVAQLIINERAARQRAETLLIDLERSNAQLKEYAARVRELATAEERSRLARDIHDSLGHYLTVIGIQLQKAEMIFHDVPHEALSSIGNATRTVNQALADVRSSVGALRGESAPFSLRKALDEMTRSLNDLPFRVDLTVEGDETRYNQQQQTALFRAIQEGLTNIQRHAQATTARIVVRFRLDQAELIMTDDGIGLPTMHPIRHGNGLRGLRERLELVDGQISVRGQAGMGTELHIRVPQTGGV